MTKPNPKPKPKLPTKYPTLTPDQLADALESDKYKRYTGALGGEKSNCCLGVYARECGVSHLALAGLGDLGELALAIHKINNPVADPFDRPLAHSVYSIKNLWQEHPSQKVHIEPKWMEDPVGLTGLLVGMNDGDYDVVEVDDPCDPDGDFLVSNRLTPGQRWPVLIIPFLRLLNVNKDNTLSRRQDASFLVKFDSDYRFNTGRFLTVDHTAFDLWVYNQIQKATAV